MRIREFKSKVYFEGNWIYMRTVLPTAAHSCSEGIPNSSPYLVFDCARSSRLHPKHFVSCPSLVCKRNVVGSGFVRVCWHKYLSNSPLTLPLGKSLSLSLSHALIFCFSLATWAASSILCADGSERIEKGGKKTYFLSLWFSCHKKCFANSRVIKICPCGIRVWFN